MWGRDKCQNILKFLKNKEMLHIPEMNTISFCMARDKHRGQLLDPLLKGGELHTESQSESASLGAGLLRRKSLWWDFLGLPESWWDEKIWSAQDYSNRQFSQSGNQVLRTKETFGIMEPLAFRTLVVCSHPHWWIFAMWIYYLCKCLFT